MKNVAHQGIIAILHSSRQYCENNLFDFILRNKNPFFLILDEITDPHNLGACVRSAYAAGVHAVIIPKNRSAKLNSTVKKVSCGASESMPVVRVTNLARVMRFLQKKNIWIIGTDEHAEKTLYQTRITGSIALVMGSESKGIRRLTRQNCNEFIRIPVKGNITSLNVSVATGVCLFEIVRQRDSYSS